MLKLQMTNNKLQISTKFQFSNLKFEAWNLFGACDLKIGALHYGT